MYSPADKGFDERLEAIDRCQVCLLRELASQNGSRLVLKGGMAMRAALGSMRLTKDIDFDRDGTISQTALEGMLRRNLGRAAATAGILRAVVEITKSTGTTVRARLKGSLSDGSDMRFDIEVSGRGTGSSENVRNVTVAPPSKYGIAPFPVVTYSNEALAAMKISAALSEQRHAPRDLYDLRDLIRAGTDPRRLLSLQDSSLLQDYIDRVFTKVEALTYALAQQELLPYLPLDERMALTEDDWLDAAILVAETVQGWCKDAIAIQGQGSAGSASAPASDEASEDEDSEDDPDPVVEDKQK
jgi:predicted nucleotidyltransferase component of viral defense system